MHRTKQKIGLKKALKDQIENAGRPRVWAMQVSEEGDQMHTYFDVTCINIVDFKGCG